MTTAHLDTFARDHLPPADQQPEFLLDHPGLQLPSRLNCAAALLDAAMEKGWGDRPCILAPPDPCADTPSPRGAGSRDPAGCPLPARATSAKHPTRRGLLPVAAPLAPDSMLGAPGVRWTFRDLHEKVDRIAGVLVNEMKLVPGNRVLLRGANSPMLAASWLAVVKAGGVAVATMAMLRAKELGTVIDIAQATHALCDAKLADALEEAGGTDSPMRQVKVFGDPTRSDSLEQAMARQPVPFEAVDTAADDVCLLGFTSGTTGRPKATMHFHRDVLASCRCWPDHVLRATPDDVFIGSPPLGFTFGLGGLLLFPLAAGASTVLLEQAAPKEMVQHILKFGATVLFTAPTAYRAMLPDAGPLRGSSLRKCVSAGEALSADTRAAWQSGTGIGLLDGLGSTEMLHIFVAHDEAGARPGAIGKAVAGYVAEVVDPEDRQVPCGVIGRLRVKGPTGCRYLHGDRQQEYVRNGWNYTGDACSIDEDGYIRYHGRTDDIIVSAGYNIAAPEVEEALRQHPAVAECGVTGIPDVQRGQIVKALVVLQLGHQAGPVMVSELQDFVKRTVAPYKYPRAVVFVDRLPRTPTGKLQRFALRTLGEGSADGRTESP